MNDRADILDEARGAEPDPPHSKLDAYAEVIWELRRKRKRIRSIAGFLNDHGVSVSKSTVARWIKRHPVPKAAPSSPHPSSSEFVGSEFFHTPPTLKQHEQPSRLYRIE